MDWSRETSQEAVLTVETGNVRGLDKRVMRGNERKK